MTSMLSELMGESNLFPMLLGLVIGWALGKAECAFRVAMKSRKEVIILKHEQRKKDERGGVRLDLAAWLILLSLVAYSVFSTAQNNSELAAQQRQDNVQRMQMERQQRCTEEFFLSLIQTVNQRTASSPEINAAELDRIVSQADFLMSVTDLTRGGATAAERERYRQALGDYRSLVDRSVSLLRDLGETQRDFTYPEVDQYRACLVATATPGDAPPPVPTPNDGNR